MRVDLHTFTDSPVHTEGGKVGGRELKDQVVITEKREVIKTYV